MSSTSKSFYVSVNLTIIAC